MKTQEDEDSRRERTANFLAVVGALCGFSRGWHWANEDRAALEPGEVPRDTRLPSSVLPVVRRLPFSIGLACLFGMGANSISANIRSTWTGMTPNALTSSTIDNRLQLGAKPKSNHHAPPVGMLPYARGFSNDFLGEIDDGVDAAGIAFVISYVWLMDYPLKMNHPLNNLRDLRSMPHSWMNQVASAYWCAGAATVCAVLSTPGRDYRRGIDLQGHRE